jgi:hypothetical protein
MLDPRRPRAWVHALALMFIALVPGMAQGISEYQLKAEFLYRFAQFVDWPEGTASTEPFVIGVLGEDPFGGALEATVRGETVNMRAFTVKHLTSAEPFDCDILFISRSESPRLKQVLQQLKGRNVLTVSDVDNFASRGGMVQFVNEARRIHLRINLDVARAADLTISSKLLRPATIVSSDSERAP